MGLAIYDSDRIKIADFSNTILSSHNGTLGEAVDVLLYLRNDNSSYYYTSVSISFQDSDMTNNDLLGPAGSGWGVKVSAGSRRPTLREWDTIAYDNTDTISTIGTTVAADTSGYYPFWVRVVVPGSIAAQVKTDLSLVVAATERLIGA